MGYYLYLEPEIKPDRDKKTGRSVKGRTPFTKGKKRTEWMSDAKIKKVVRMTSKNLHPNPNIGKVRCKPIFQLSLDGKTLGWFNSSIDAHNKTGVNATCIRKCCRGHYHTAGGFRWIYDNR